MAGEPRSPPAINPAGAESMLKNHVLPYFGTSQFESVAPTDIQESDAHITEKGLTSSTIRQNYLLIASLFSSALESDLICGLPRTPRGLSPARTSANSPANDRTPCGERGSSRRAGRI